MAVPMNDEAVEAAARWLALGEIKVPQRTVLLLPRTITLDLPLARQVAEAVIGEYERASQSPKARRAG